MNAGSSAIHELGFFSGCDLYSKLYLFFLILQTTHLNMFRPKENKKRS